MPMIPVSLANGIHRAERLALIDSGATVNVMPFSLGKALGFEWDRESNGFVLTGAAGGVSSKVVAIKASIRGFEPVDLAFAWADTDSIRLILGQSNFFEQFTICFSARELKVSLLQIEAEQ